MKPRISLFDEDITFVADASVAINLNASGLAYEILRVLSRRVVVVDTVVNELSRGRDRGHRDAEMLEGLINDGLLEVVSLTGEALEQFEDLVVGPAELTLDDGEAATIAYAWGANGIPIIDERKARKICGERFPNLKVACTVDVFNHTRVQRSLGKEIIGDAICKTLRKARMRVPPEHLDWVIGVVGREQAASCLSLPKLARPPRLTLPCYKTS